MYEEIFHHQMPERIANDDFHILKIKSYFDLKDKMKIVDDALLEFSLKNKDIYTNYKGLGLQYDDDENPYYDVVNSISVVDNNGIYKLNRKLGGIYIKKNSIGEKLTDIFDFFSGTLYLIRGRILVSEPGNKIREHTDGLCSATLHYVVKTDPEAKFVIDRQEYHIPSDGSFYLINAARPHYIENRSSQNRIHITFPVNPACFKTLTQNQFGKMQKYFKQFNLDPSQFSHLKITD